MEKYCKWDNYNSCEFYNDERLPGYAGVLDEVGNLCINHFNISLTNFCSSFSNKQKRSLDNGAPYSSIGIIEFIRVESIQESTCWERGTKLSASLGYEKLRYGPKPKFSNGRAILRSIVLTVLLTLGNPGNITDTVLEGPCQCMIGRSITLNSVIAHFETGSPLFDLYGWLYQIYWTRTHFIHTDERFLD